MAAIDRPGSASFPATQWSLLGLAKATDIWQRQGAVEELLRLYLPALRAHLLRHHRIEPHRAEDLLQGFIARKVLERDLLAKADASRGKFRSFLLKSLENYVLSALQRERGRKEVCFEEGGRDPAAPPVADVFDAAWARELLQETLRRMGAECEQKDRMDLWELFQCQIVVPAFTGDTPPSYQLLVAKFGYRSAEQASNALVTAKRQFERALRAIIVETEFAGSEE